MDPIVYTAVVAASGTESEVFWDGIFWRAFATTENINSGKNMERGKIKVGKRQIGREFTIRR
ncbi:hypothetical protein SLEP1_g31639 [Rubroshorea leprosula]|uniref:Uncharacterized protein n=1 Tax=Rubroshorea leprosula TaxID=152421 RepID=A0AAV5KAN5_9ROSI|nr:hypothetical protein SLEP1_g31639 [Rubroshorea leprosula]